MKLVEQGQSANITEKKKSQGETGQIKRTSAEGFTEREMRALSQGKERIKGCSDVQRAKSG